MDKIIESVKKLNGSRKPSPDLSRSQYSLVSTGDLTAGAVELWMGLPEEVKYDPVLAPFRQYYEKEHGNFENISLTSKNSVPKVKRLPLVNSAPHLNNNVHIVRNEISAKYSSDDDKKQEKILETEENEPRKKSKMALARHYVKMALLLTCWGFFTVVFLMYNEKEELIRNTPLMPGEIKSYELSNQGKSLSMMLTLSGPFLSEQTQSGHNTSVISSSKLEVWLETWNDEAGMNKSQMSTPWKILLDEENLDFSQGESRSSRLHISSETNGSFAIRMRSTSNQTIAFTMSYQLNPLDSSTGLIYSSLLLCGLYVLIIFEVINRTMASILLSTTSLAVLAIAGERPSLTEVISWLDVETLLLLFSMMLLVAIMAETGMFDFVAVFTFEVTRGKIWPLISLLCIITAVLSTFLDNVTTVLLMTPVTIRLCEVMDMDPIPVLMSMVLYSNIGGTATPVGDPPNVIIASNKAVVQAGINFTNFTLHMTLGILFVCIQTYFQLRFIYRDTKKLRLNEPREIQDLRHQISIWRRAADSLPHLSRDEQVVRNRLERKVQKLSSQLEILMKESKKRACPKDTFRTTLSDMKDKGTGLFYNRHYLRLKVVMVALHMAIFICVFGIFGKQLPCVVSLIEKMWPYLTSKANNKYYKIRDKALLVKATVAILFVVTVFFLHSIPTFSRVSLGWTALLGAILLLTLADREDLEPILHRVEWSTLLFFAALFVLMEALSKLGLIEFIGGITEAIILGVDERARLAVALLLMLWVSGITSAFVDNIPLTTMMIRVVTSLGSNPNLNLPMAPLIWALSFGACLGGNGTLIGASANVVCAGVAEQHGYKFTFMHFFKIGFPIMIGHLVVASIYLLMCHCVFTWH